MPSLSITSDEKSRLSRYARKDAPAVIPVRRVALAARELPTRPHTGPTSPPLSVFLPCPPPPARPRGTPCVASSQAQKPRTECRPQGGGRKPPSSAMPPGSRSPFPWHKPGVLSAAVGIPPPFRPTHHPCADALRLSWPTAPNPALTPKARSFGQSSRKRLARIAHNGLEADAEGHSNHDNRPVCVLAVNGLGGGIPRSSRANVCEEGRL